MRSSLFTLSIVVLGLLLIMAKVTSTETALKVFFISLFVSILFFLGGIFKTLDETETDQPFRW